MSGQERALGSLAQGGESIRRTHELVERRWPFTRDHEVANADLAALLSEYGMIVASTAVVYPVESVNSSVSTAALSAAQSPSGSNAAETS